MKLTVLGGSAAGPNTGQGCSGYLVECGDVRIVLDLGPGTLPELRRHTDFRTLDGIVVSHLHMDHVLDLLALRFALAYNPTPAPMAVPLWLPPGGLAFLKRAASTFAASGEESTYFTMVFAVAEYDPAGILEIGGLKVSFAPTVHPIPCWAIRVADQTQPGRDLLYTADTGPAADLASFGAGAAVVVAEATESQPGDWSPEQRGHLTPPEAGAIAAKIGAETLVLTHLWEEDGRDEAPERAARTFGGRIELARPGLRLDW